LLDEKLNINAEGNVSSNLVEKVVGIVPIRKKKKENYLIKTS